jgi:type IV secretory pathway TrbD component
MENTLIYQRVLGVHKLMEGAERWTQITENQLTALSQVSFLQDWIRGQFPLTLVVWSQNEANTNETRRISDQPLLKEIDSHLTNPDPQ